MKTNIDRTSLGYYKLLEENKLIGARTLLVPKEISNKVKSLCGIVGMYNRKPSEAVYETIVIKDEAVCRDIEDYLRGKHLASADAEQKIKSKGDVEFPDMEDSMNEVASFSDIAKKIIAKYSYVPSVEDEHSGDGRLIKHRVLLQNKRTVVAELYYTEKGTNFTISAKAFSVAPSFLSFLNISVNSRVWRKAHSWCEKQVFWLQKFSTNDSVELYNHI